MIDSWCYFSLENYHDTQDNAIYHCFLMDKNDEIVLVGDPVASDAMWNLFKATLDNMLAHDGVYVPDEKN